MTEAREAKRVRRACLNCRRKKTRCSGEQPVCAFCARLGQICNYGNPASSYCPPPGNLQPENKDLATRVAFLESRLSLLDSENAGAATAPFPSSSDFPTQRPRSEGRPFSSAVGGHAGSPLTFSAVPDSTSLQSLVDIYFHCCESQPYCYFHEATFRTRLESGILPSYLLLALAATAVRFSNDSIYEGRRLEALHDYSQLAWQQIMNECFSEDFTLSIWTAVAASMLAVLDFVGGRTKLAWVKTGLAVRFAQRLGLNKEAVEHDMSPTEREERRRTFWSIYLLDRLVSCGPDKPPTLLDNDCTVRLPCDEFNFRQGSPLETAQLAMINDIPNTTALHRTDYFALTIFMASVLGATVRFCFQRTPTDRHLPWDSRSEFSRINGVLLSFETYSEACTSSFESVLDREFSTHGVVDFAIASHFTFAHVLYHTNQCLLHNPFLLRQHLRSCKTRIPPSFLGYSVAKSLEHAAHLASLLNCLLQRGCTVYPFLYGYAAVLAGVILRLHTKSSRSVGRESSEEHLKTCISFLDQKFGLWKHHKRMCMILQNFEPDTSAVEYLLSSSSPAGIDQHAFDELWHIFDYSWLANSERALSTTGSTDFSFDMNLWSLPSNDKMIFGNEFDNGNDDQFLLYSKLF